ncbi:MAG: hypothetical protein PHV51_10520 [Methanosarcinaceae archaeon]|nr:hypothetical protein [Methanosarcinaceae archaeon]
MIDKRYLACKIISGYSNILHDIMKTGQKAWTFSPKKPPMPKVPDDLKEEMETKAKELIESFLKPEHIKTPSEDMQFNYVVDIYTKWYRSYFYFCAKYASPGPNAISPFFETKFARMEYVGDGLFNLSYMRHTGKWFELFQDLSLDECLEAIKDYPHFLP